MKTSILAIAGSDSISGAGIQIDIKVASSFGVHCTCAVTAITAQNTMGVRGVQLANPDMVCAQVDAVFDDVPPNAIKIGMLGSTELVQAVARSLERHPGIPVVLDPVLVATSGASLSDGTTARAILDLLVPISTVVTPNVPEAEVLSETRITTAEDVATAAHGLLARGAANVLIKGGHGLDGGNLCIDRLFGTRDEGGSRESGGSNAVASRDSGGGNASASRESELLLELESPRIEGEFHGTGCTTSTAIACGLAEGLSVADAVTRAHDKVAGMIRGAADIALGRGTSIIDPF